MGDDEEEIVYLLFLVFVCSVSHADLLFKMDASVTDLAPGGTALVTVSAKAEGVSGTNGLMVWGFVAIVDTDGVVEIVDGSITFLAPSPYYVDDTKWTSFDRGTTGGTGSIEYLRLAGDESLAFNSTTGANVYTPIAQFEVQAIGTVGQSVNYLLGGDNFGGLLADLERSLTMAPPMFRL